MKFPVCALLALATTAHARIDAMLQALWPKARRGDVQAIDRVIKLEQWREQLTLAAAAPAEPAEESRVSKLGQLRAIHGGGSGPS